MRIPGHRRRRPSRAPPARPGSPLAVDVAGATFGALLTIAGELDIATAPQVRAASATPVVVEADAVVVDLSGVTFMDSTGLALFLDLQRDLLARNRRLVIACPEGPARLLFDVTGVDQQVQLYPSREAAEAALTRTP